MRHFFTLLLALLLAFAASGQSVTWCPPGAEWYFTGYHQGYTGYAHIKCEGDTIVDGRACKRLAEHFRGVGMYTNDTSDLYFNRYSYEANGVVYAFNQESGHGWDTLYNFNAVPGDNWKYYGFGVYFNVIVTDTGSTVKQGYQLRWFKCLTGTDVYVHTDTIFERIGMAGFNYGNIQPLFTFGHDLCSYSDSSFTNWPHSDASCAVLPPISREEEIAAPAFTAYPNPVAGKSIHLGFTSWQSGQVEIELLDIFGRKIAGKQYKLSENVSENASEIELPLMEVSAGVYFLKVRQENRSGVVKIIRQ